MANADLPGPGPGGSERGPAGADDGGSSIDATQATQGRSVRGAAIFVVVSALAGVGLAVPAALLWVKVADPPTAPLTQQGVFFGEIQLNQDSEITLWFLVIGVGFGLLAGLVVGWLGRRRGVVTVAAVVALSAVAAALTAFLGISVFGPDAKAEAANAAVGDLITGSLSVGSPLVYLGWPIGGLAGACVAILAWPVPDIDEQADSPSSTHIAH